jgi:hypothetical protein
VLLPMMADMREVTTRDWHEFSAYDDMIELMINLIDEGALYWA